MSTDCVGSMPECFRRDDRQLLVERAGQENGPHMEVSPLQLDGCGPPRSGKAGQDGLLVVIITSVCFSVSVTVALILTIHLGPPQVPPHAGVVSDSSVCSEVGIDLLKQGGSAVDAAVALSLCVGVVDPSNSGIGGGGVMVVRQHKANTSKVIDFMDAVPHSFSATGDVTGVSAVAVPGLLYGLKYAHSQFGKLEWEKVLMSVVEHLKEMEKAKDLLGLIGLVARDGVEDFYNGTIAAKLSGEIKKAGGEIAASDFAQYSCSHGDIPISTSFFDKTVETASSSSDGPVLVTILNIVEHLVKNGTTAFNASNFYHYVIEAVKMAYAADVENDVDTSKEFAATLASRIDPDKTIVDGSYYLINKPSNQNQAVDLNTSWNRTNQPSGSTHISVIGPFDDMVSVTLSLGDEKGSGLQSSYGFYFNNHLSTVRSYSTIKRGGHLPSSVSPAVVYSTRSPCAQRLALGAAHGYLSAAALAEVLIHDVVLKMDLVDAVNASRVYPRVFMEDAIFVDGTLPADVQDMLVSKGHKPPFSPMQAGTNTAYVMSKLNEIVADVTDGRRSVVTAATY